MADTSRSAQSKAPSTEAGAKPRGLFARYWHVPLFLVGLGGMAYLIHKVGVAAILEKFTQLGWGLALLVFAFVVPSFFDSLGWRFAFKTLPRGLTQWRLFWIRVAGEAVNNTTWSMDMGGEPVKVALVARHGVSVTEAAAAAVVAKTTMTMGLVLFLAFGLLSTITVPQVSEELAAVFALFTIVGMGLIALFFIVQRRGFFSFLAALARKIRPARKWVERHDAKIKELDDHIGGYYVGHKKRFAASIGFHFLGWMTGTIEIYLILSFLGLFRDDASLLFGWDYAVLINVAHHLSRTVSFFLPYNLGTQEGGNYGIFEALRYANALEIGVSVSIIRRIRELIWSAIGWVALLALNHHALSRAMKSAKTK